MVSKFYNFVDRIGFSIYSVFLSCFSVFQCSLNPPPLALNRNRLREYIEIYSGNRDNKKTYSKVT